MITDDAASDVTCFDGSDYQELYADEDDNTGFFDEEPRTDLSFSFDLGGSDDGWEVESCLGNDFGDFDF